MTEYVWYAPETDWLFIMKANVGPGSTVQFHYWKDDYSHVWLASGEAVYIGEL